ncbi:MAG: tRNA pseudouridine(55) synthase TruB [Deltaproteobacteria bacterium]|nr:tRNA pseudouridine(55) synthase TruB [Deltaproteobacteria bacterium]
MMSTRGTNCNDDGIIVIDKPGNMSSAKVVARVKSALGAKKVGHTGTLDPFATGVLICCINRATRLARFFLHGDKAYEATLRLGIETDTQDATGAVISENEVADISKGRLADVFQTFEGWMDQVPPAYSALKYKGVPLYKLARQGTPVKKPARKVCISSIRILEIDFPHIRFEVHCSAGTYIRTLCADIGKVLGCGGHLEALRRTRSSGFTLDDAFSLSRLEQVTGQGDVADRMIDMTQALQGMEMVVADSHLAQKIAHGITLTGKDIVVKGLQHGDRYVKIVGSAHELLAVVQLKKARKQYDYCCVFQ